MKKLVMTAVALTCVASIASAQTITSANTVGYTRVNAIGGELTLVAVNFDTSGITLQDLIGTDVPSLSGIFKWDKQTDTYAVSTLNSRGSWSPNLVLDLGDALFIQPAGSGTNELIIPGEVLLNDAIIGIPTGIRATGYFFPVNTAWTGTELSDDLPALSGLFTWDEVAQSYNVSTKNSRGTWSADPVIGPAQAFFIDNSGGPITSTNTVPFTP